MSRDEKGRQASDAFADGLRTLFAKRRSAQSHPRPRVGRARGDVSGQGARKSGAEANPDRDPLQLSLSDLPVKKDQGLLIQFEVQSEKLRDFAADVPRIITVTPSALPGWPEKKNQPQALLGWSTSQDFTPVSFCFREPTADVRLAIQITIQGQQTVHIRNFTIRDATEVFARQYEHGVVRCKPNERTPWTFDLGKLFSGITLRRIAGSDYDKHMA